jgi:hypothetical protein
MLTLPKMEKARFSPRLDIGFSEYSEEFNGCLARGSMTAYRNGGSRSRDLLGIDVKRLMQLVFILLAIALSTFHKRHLTSRPIRLSQFPPIAGWLGTPIAVHCFGAMEVSNRRNP